MLHGPKVVSASLLSTVLEFFFRDTEIANCGLSYGGGGGGVCSPDYYNCYAECYDVSCCYDYTCSGGSYYGYLNW